MNEIEIEAISVSDFINILNNTFEFNFGVVAIVGELANYRVSKNKWVYFDLKDEQGSLKFFGTVFQIRQPLEEGMLVKVYCYPHMHSNYGFSMQIQAIELVGEGSLKRAAELLQYKLSQEGLFAEDRKRKINYPPERIGLITSSQSAAYSDFLKIINARWRGIDINLYDVQVQGEPAVSQIVNAIKYFNSERTYLDCLVIIRGGGSPEDLAAFNSEGVTRAVAASQIPTIVAVGHEIDVSLAELAADKRASTPSNAAELLVPDRRQVLKDLKQTRSYLKHVRHEVLNTTVLKLKTSTELLHKFTFSRISLAKNELKAKRQLLSAYNPEAVLSRGYAVVRQAGKVVLSSNSLSIGAKLEIQLAKGSASTTVNKVN